MRAIENQDHLIAEESQLWYHEGMASNYQDSDWEGGEDRHLEAAYEDRFGIEEYGDYDHDFWEDELDLRDEDEESYNEDLMDGADL